MLTLFGAQNRSHKCKGWVEKGWTIMKRFVQIWKLLKQCCLEVSHGGLPFGDLGISRNRSLRRFASSPTRGPLLEWKERPTFPISNWFSVVDQWWQAILAASLLLSLQRSWQARQITLNDPNFGRMLPKLWKDPSSRFCFLLFCLHMLSCTL